MRPIEEVSDEDWHAIIDINLHAAFALARASAPGMKKAKKGRIVTISSGAGLKASLTGIQAYGSAKHGLVGLTRQLAREFGPYGITVNSVAPGFVLSNPSSIKQFESYGEEGQKALIGRLAMRQLGSVEDISECRDVPCKPLCWLGDRAGAASGWRQCMIRDSQGATMLRG